MQFETFQSTMTMLRNYGNSVDPRWVTIIA